MPPKKNKKKHNSGFVNHQTANVVQTSSAVVHNDQQVQQQLIQLVIPDDYQRNKETIKILEDENNKLKKENKELKEKLESYQDRIITLTESVTKHLDKLENLEKENEKLKLENEELKRRVEILEQEKKEREERIIIGEIAYSFERQIINKIFSEREDRVKYRLKISDIFNQDFKKSEKEEQMIQDFKNIWGDKFGGEPGFISRAIKQLKNFRVQDAHGDKIAKANLTHDYLHEVVERVFKLSNSTKTYEKEDALSLLSLLTNIAQDKTYPLNE